MAWVDRNELTSWIPRKAVEALSMDASAPKDPIQPGRQPTPAAMISLASTQSGPLGNGDPCAPPKSVRWPWPGAVVYESQRASSLHRHTPVNPLLCLFQRPVLVRSHIPSLSIDCIAAPLPLSLADGLVYVPTTSSVTLRLPLARNRCPGEDAWDPADEGHSSWEQCPEPHRPGV